MSARKKECNQLPARKSIKFGARKSVMSALEKERIIYSRETNPQRPNARKQQNLTDLRAKKRREKNPQLPAKQGESRDITFLPPAYARTTITSKSPSEAVFIKLADTEEQTTKLGLLIILS
jgi:hypothetical protein